MNSRGRVWCACVAVLLSLAVGQLRAVAADSAVDGLIKVVPEDALAFVATAGGDALRADFEKSIMGRIWNDPGVQTFYQSIKTQVWAMLQKEAGDPNEIKQVDMVLALAKLTAGRPIAAGMAPLHGPAQDKDAPPVYAFAVLDAGTHKAQFEAVVKQVETLIGADQIADVNVGSAKMHGPKGSSDMPLYWGWSGNYLVVAVNDANGLTLQSLQKPRATIAPYFAKVPGGGNALVAHLNVAKVVSFIQAFAGQAAPAQGQMVTAFVKGLGISDVKTATARVGFAGTDLVAGSYREAPAPRTGIPAALKPVDPAWLDMVDSRAVTASAINVDIAGVYDTIMQTVKTVAGEDFADVEKGLASLEAEIKVNIRKDLLGSLAGPVVVYSMGMGAMPEAPMGGFAAFIKLKDAASFEKAMTTLTDYAAAQSKGMLQTASQTREDGTTVHTLVIPQLALMGMTPAWSIAKDYAVIGSNAAIHDAAVAQMTATGEQRKSIRETAGYKEVASRLPENLLSLSYTDSQTQYTQMMMGLQQMWPMATMFAAKAGMQLPAMLPQLGPIFKDMKPSLRTCWAQPDGLYSQYRGPGLEVSMATVAGAGVGAAIVLPALARTREQARVVASMSNLKQIGSALAMYADGNGGKFPQDMQGLEEYLGNSSTRVLESPRRPKGFTGPSYIYIPGQSPTPQGSKYIVVYENPEFSDTKVIVLLLDYSIRAMSREEFLGAMKTTYERLGKPVPEIKFQDGG